MKEGKNRETKPCIKREEQESKTLYKKRRTGEQNPIKKSGRKKKKKKNTEPCLSKLLNTIYNYTNDAEIPCEKPITICNSNTMIY